MDTHPTSPDKFLLEQLTIIEPTSLLLFDSNIPHAIQQYKKKQDFTLQHQNNFSADRIKHTLYDLSIINFSNAKTGRQENIQLVAKIRNQFTQRLLVFINGSTEWQPNDFYSLGLKKLISFSKDKQSILCYSYNINQYNKKRSWNNPKSWANPENFGKYWW